MRKDDKPDFDLGTVPLKVGRVFRSISKKDGTSRTYMMMGVAGGKAEKNGVKIDVCVTFNGDMIVSFERPGDSDDETSHQKYHVRGSDIAEALFELNERRRAIGFTDAPFTEDP